MKPTEILLPPDVEPYVRRLAIGAGQPEYFVIPAIEVEQASGGVLRALISRWELSASEKNAVARSELRGMVLAFAMWLANECRTRPGLGDELDSDTAALTLARAFIDARPDQLGGEDAAVWYTRLMPHDDKFQPMEVVVSTETPIDVVHEPAHPPAVAMVPLSPLVH